MEALRDYIIVSRWLEAGEGWKKVEEELTGTVLATAWERASQLATELDKAYGNDHFWTVDVKDPEYSSYVQLFHGRLR